MHRTTAAALLAALVAAPAVVRGQEAAHADAPAWHDRLAEAIRTAVAQNPGLRATAARADAARHRVPQTRALPDPEIEVGLKDVPVQRPSLTRDDFTMEMVAARQSLPRWGERRAAWSAAQASLEGASAELAEQQIEVASAAAEAFLALAETDWALAILETSAQRLSRAAASVTELFRVGRTGQADVLRAHLEETSLKERVAALRADRRAQAARLNAVQGLPAENPVPPSEPIGLAEADFLVPPREELVQQALDASPAVAAAAAAVREAEAELDLARFERRPEWTLMGYYGRREEFEDFVGFSAALSLPFVRRERLAERGAEKEAEHLAAAEEIAAVRNTLRGEVEATYAELEKNREQLRLYRDVILPQAEINFEAAREAYTVGRVDFLTLVSAALDLDAYQREAAARATGIGRAAAALQRASGVPLLPGMPAQGDDHDVEAP